MIVALDLASKMSGCCVMDSRGAVLDEISSWDMYEDDFIDWIVRPWVKHKNATQYYEKPDILLVEDIPFSYKQSKYTKKVTRIQGKILDRMAQLGFEQDVLFVPPATWLRSYGIKMVKDSAKLVEPKARELGYEPPIDYQNYHGKERQMVKKSQSDYCAAYLLGLWMVNYYKEHGTYDEPSTQRYE